MELATYQTKGKASLQLEYFFLQISGEY